MFFQGHDLNILTETLLSGYIADGINRPINENGYLIIIKVDVGYCVQTYQSVISCCTFRRQQVDGVWQGWKLIAGEVVLWSGSLSTGGAIFNVNYDINMFNTLIIQTSTDYWLSAPIIKNSNMLMGVGSFSQANNVVYVLSAFMTKRTDKSILLNYPLTASVLTTNAVNYNYSLIISKIIGRP